MKFLFISQPVKNKTEEEIDDNNKRIFNLIKSQYDNEEIILLDWLYEKFTSKSNISLAEKLSNTEVYLAKADIAYFSKGYKDSFDCMLDYIQAKQYEIETIITED